MRGRICRGSLNTHKTLNISLTSKRGSWPQIEERSNVSNFRFDQSTSDVLSARNSLRQMASERPPFFCAALRWTHQLARRSYRLFLRLFFLRGDRNGQSDEKTVKSGHTLGKLLKIKLVSKTTLMPRLDFGFSLWVAGWGRLARSIDTNSSCYPTWESGCRDINE